MKTISRWARNNPKKARIIIGFSHLFAIINAVFLGVLLFVFDYGASKWSYVIIANLFFILYISYPKRGIKKGLFKYSYARQKTHDFFLVAFYSLIIAFGFNSYLIQDSYDNDLGRQPKVNFFRYSPNVDNQILDGKNLTSEIRRNARKLKKMIRHELRVLKKEFKRKGDKKMANVVKILLFMLAILGGIALCYLIAALSCNISCSGYEGLAIAVLVLGVVGVVWLVVLVYRILWGRIARKKKVLEAVE